MVPGHGWIADGSEVGYYRDMMIVIRDRIQDMIGKKMTPGAGEGREADAGLRSALRPPAGLDREVRSRRYYRSLTEKKEK